MPKKKSWFQWMRDYLFPSTDKQEGKRKKRKKRWVFRWMKAKRSPSLAAPPLSMQEGINGGLKRQCNGNQSNLANGSEVSAEGVAAKDVSGVATRSTADSPRFMTIMTSHEENISNSEEVRCSKNNEGHAATKLQTAFRGYLARKALRALKGLVRLQAIIRGRAVRRQAVATLKCLQSIVNIQSQVCATRYQMACEKIHHKEIRDSGYSKYEGLKIEVKKERRWDDSLLTEEEEKFLLSTRTEAVTRRERMKAYTFNGRHSAEFEDGSASRRLRNWTDQYMTEYQVPQKEEIKRVDTVGGKQLRLTRMTQVSHQPRCIQGLDSPTLMLPRRSLHHKRRKLIMADERADSSLPTYMASTESAKAKARSMSMSSPRRQRALHPDVYSDGDSPYKCKISPISSINSERTWSGTSVTAKNIGCSHCSYPRSSPSLKGVFDTGCHRKGGSSKDLGLEFQSWLLNWN